MMSLLHIPELQPDQRILLVRGQPVLLDADLAELYDVPTKVLNQAVRRNADRFPDDFLFVLTADESAGVHAVRSTRMTGRGGRRYATLAFTEYGVAMRSSVLRSRRAVAVNIQIMRAFGRLRGLIAAHVDIARRLDELEAKTTEHDMPFAAVFTELRRLVAPPPGQDPPRRQIGFVTDE